MSTASPDAAALARELAGGSVSLEQGWRTVLQRLASCGVDADLAWLARAAGAPSRAEALALLLRGEPDPAELVRAWRRACDTGGWAAADYTAAILAVVEHARAGGVRALPSSISGYVVCAAEAAQARGDTALEPAVRAFLRDHGFAGV